MLVIKELQVTVGSSVYKAPVSRNGDVSRYIGALDTPGGDSVIVESLDGIVWNIHYGVSDEVSVPVATLWGAPSKTVTVKDDTWGSLGISYHDGTLKIVKS